VWWIKRRKGKGKGKEQEKLEIPNVDVGSKPRT
jgi:hypothetical protein